MRTVYNKDWWQLGVRGSYRTFVPSIGDYDWPADEQTNNRCHRSSAAYPARIAQAFGEPFTHAHNPSDTFLFAACSGAESKHVGTFAQFPGTPRNATPGYYTQVEHLEEFRVAGGGVDFVTISVGGNDFGFTDLIKDCLLGSCVGTGSKEKTARSLEAAAPGSRRPWRRCDRRRAVPRCSCSGTPTSSLRRRTPPRWRAWSTRTNEKLRHQGPAASRQRRRGASCRGSRRELRRRVEGVLREGWHEPPDLRSASDGSTGSSFLGAEPAPMVPIGSWEIDMPIGTGSFHPNALGHQALHDMFMEQVGYYAPDAPATRSRRHGASTEPRAASSARPSSARLACGRLHRRPAFAEQGTILERTAQHPDGRVHPGTTVISSCTPIRSRSVR